MCSKTEEETLLCYDGKGRLKWYVSSNRYVRKEQIPQMCPVSLKLQHNPVRVWGHWDRIYDGNVDQELFQAVPGQILVLLGGDKWKYIPNTYE